LAESVMQYLELAIFVWGFFLPGDE